MNGTSAREVSSELISEILSVRAEELFRLVKDVIDERNLNDEINGGFIITGGGAMIKDLVTLGEFIFSRPCRVGFLFLLEE